MRYSLLALAATTLLSGSVAARGHHQQHRRHAHPAALAPRGECSTAPPTCVTYTSSVLVPVGTVQPSSPGYSSPATTVKQTLTVVPVVEPTTTVRSTTTSTSYSTAVVTVTRSSSSSYSSSYPTYSSPKPPAVVPTPVVTVCPTPGVYTFPAKTIILTSTEYACVPTTTSLPPGPNTYGGVTTVVVTATTVVCPYATLETNSGVTTSKVIMTTYVCPSAGTYTIGPTTTTITGTVTVPCEYPVPTVYNPGTYIQPELTTTITVTSQVVTCPYTNGLPEPTSAPAPPPATNAPPATTTPTAPPAPPASSSQPSSAPSPTSTPKLISGDGHWAITYSPYTANGGCKSSAEVLSDITAIASKGFKNVRLYASDCSGLQNVGDACEKNGLGIILGIFIKNDGIAPAEDQLKAILAWNKLSLVVLFVVGNESVFNGFCSAADLAAFIKKVKSALQGGGYNGPVTTTETLNIILANKDVLCPVMDVVGVNVQPFFDGGVTADHAGTFLVGQLKIAQDACGGKDGYVLEAGWPSAGNPNGVAVPGVDEQRTAIMAIIKEAPGKVTYFSFENDLWKAGGAFGVEQNFGCAGLF